MPRIERDIEVEAPLTAVYNQWTQFEEFPRFMEGVQEVKQLDPRRLFWTVEVAGRVDEWEAEIDRQEPDELISWHSTAGRGMDGVVMFRPAGEDRTNVHLEIAYEQETWAESVGDALGLVEGRVEGDLERFKEFIESRGHETGGWRGEIHSAEVRDGHPVVDDDTVETHRDAERTTAEERQREPSPSETGAAPGGGPVIDPNTGQPRQV